MDELEYPMTKSERNQISRDRTRHLQLALTDLLMLTSTYALSYLELVAEQHEEKLGKEFSLAFEPFQWTKLVISILDDGRRAVLQGIDLGYLGLELKDFYGCLSPETQSKLRSHGIHFDAPPAPPPGA